MEQVSNVHAAVRDAVFEENALSLARLLTWARDEARRELNDPVTSDLIEDARLVLVTAYSLKA
jgi:hypothetical protein